MNDDTEVRLTPYPEFVKALGVEGAAPLVGEDLEGAAHPTFEAEWHDLTARIQRLRGCTAGQARELALGVLIRRGRVPERPS